MNRTVFTILFVFNAIFASDKPFDFRPKQSSSSNILTYVAAGYQTTKKLFQRNTPLEDKCDALSNCLTCLGSAACCISCSTLAVTSAASITPCSAATPIISGICATIGCIACTNDVYHLHQAVKQFNMLSKMERD